MRKKVITLVDGRNGRVLKRFTRQNVSEGKWNALKRVASNPHFFDDLSRTLRRVTMALAPR